MIYYVGSAAIESWPCTRSSHHRDLTLSIKLYLKPHFYIDIHHLTCIALHIELTGAILLLFCYAAVKSPVHVLTVNWSRAFIRGFK